MHAFGDEKKPCPQTIELMCGMLLEFMDKTITDAQRIALYKGEFDADCLLFVCKSDLRMFKSAKDKRKRFLALNGINEKKI